MKKIIYIDLDNTLADYLALAQEMNVEPKDAKRIQGFFAQLQPMPGAIDAYNRLAEHFDVYILSTAPWNNPSAWSDKVIWITKHLDDVFHKKVVITHCKHLCKGDILIDDRDKHGVTEFEGEWIHFGSERFPNWETVLEYLLTI